MAKRLEMALDLSRSATHPQARFDAELASEDDRIEGELYTFEWLSAFNDYDRYTLERCVQCVQRHCLRAWGDVKCTVHTPRAFKGLHVVPKRKQQKWKVNPDWAKVKGQSLELAFEGAAEVAEGYGGCHYCWRAGRLRWLLERCP